MINTNNSIFTILFAVTFLLVNIIRSLQLILMTDASTGFYYENYEATSSILTVITALAAVIIVLLSLTGKQKKTMGIPKPNNFLGISQIMLGVCMIIEPFFVVELPSTIPPVLKTAKTLLIIISGIVFVILGFINFMGKKPNYVLMVIPSLSFVARILVTFICYTGMSGISSNLYEILNLCLCLAFLHFSSKILCNVAGKRSEILTRIFGLLAILSSSLCSIPQMATTIFGNQGLHVAVDSIITNLFMTVYIIAFMVSKKEKHEEVTVWEEPSSTEN